MRKARVRLAAVSPARKTQRRGQSKAEPKAKAQRGRPPLLRSADELIVHTPRSDVVAYRRRTTVGYSENQDAAGDLIVDAFEEASVFMADEEFAFRAAAVGRYVGAALLAGSNLTDEQRTLVDDMFGLMKGTATIGKRRSAGEASELQRLRAVAAVQWALDSLGQEDEAQQQRVADGLVHRLGMIDREFYQLDRSEVRDELTRKRGMLDSICAWLSLRCGAFGDQRQRGETQSSARGRVAKTYATARRKTRKRTPSS